MIWKVLPGLQGWAVLYAASVSGQYGPELTKVVKGRETSRPLEGCCGIMTFVIEANPPQDSRESLNTLGTRFYA